LNGYLVLSSSATAFITVAYAWLLVYVTDLLCCYSQILPALANLMTTTWPRR